MKLLITVGAIALAATIVYKIGYKNGERHECLKNQEIWDQYIYCPE